MFYLETRLEDGQLNNIQIVKLKNKLGTRQLPTAELLLTGTIAHLVGDVGRGVSTISDMLTVSRMYNSVFASSATRRFENSRFDLVILSSFVITCVVTY